MTVKIDFEFQTDYGVFRDALYLPDDHGLTDEQIEALKIERRDNWITVVTTPPPPEPETIELGGILFEKVEVDGQTLLKPVGA